MKWSSYLITLFLVFIAFLFGAWVSWRPASPHSSPRKILYYVDPMHPSYRSDKPGIAPDCGMPLEPVYEDGKVGSSLTLPPGAVRVDTERLQQIGVRLGKVEKSAAGTILRLPGKVAPDERKLYIINSTIDGWITEAGTATTGSLVKKDDVLATFYSPEFLSAAQALLFALNSIDRVQSATPRNPSEQGQMEQYGINLQQYKDTLKNLGMGDRQIHEMIRTKKFMENVDITAPGDGFVIGRYVSQGLRIDKGKELFRIADLSRVWILVDTYGEEAKLFKPGKRVSVTLAGTTSRISAVVSSVLPQFDPVSRTLKVRLEADNPGYTLRPDMFVDVELPISTPEMLAIPLEAVIDSGMKKTVFVHKGDGLFVPRAITTGPTYGAKVQVLAGLSEGEEIAISGTFLLDSESRMRMTASGITGSASPDPVCGMYVDEEKSRSKGLVRESGGKTYYFCSEECLRKFQPPSTTRSPSPPPRHITEDKGKTSLTSHPGSAPDKTEPRHDGGTHR